MAVKNTRDKQRQREAPITADQDGSIHDYTAATAVADQDEDNGILGGIAEVHGLGWFLYMF